MPASETIYYSSSRLLKWSDFKGQPDQSSVAAAITASGFGYKADFKSSGGKAQLNVGVYCYFNKTGSWVKQGKTTTYILNHEQQHFDISYIAAGIFFQKLKTCSITKDNYKTLLPKIYNDCVALMNKMQNDYDSQTKNGQLKDEQAKWDAYIDKQLEQPTR
ncbi:MAG: hypothetical protein QM687_13085 [Ferruginibacter sp.]